MKIATLELLAFGPFTDCVLDLSAGDHGLHVIHGANEAGKSSALRAVRSWLFGIDARSSDNFLHPYKRMLVGGTLTAADGSSLTCYRRKGNKNTLLGEDRQTLLDEALLARRLGGVTEPLFLQQFGISHDTLVSGGANLLADSGAEGSTLFGTGLGSSSVQQVLAQLDADAGGIFKSGNARIPSLNARLAILAAARKELKDLALSARVWAESRDALQRAQQHKDAVAAMVQAAGVRREVLQRVRRTAPALNQRQALLAELAALGPLPELPEDAPERFQQASIELRRAEQDLQARSERRQQLQAQLSAVSPAAEMVAAAPVVRQLSQRISGYRTERQDRTTNVGPAVQRDEQALASLAGQRNWPLPELGARVQRVLAVRRRVNELGGKADGLEQVARQAQQDLASLTAQLVAQQQRLQELPEPSGIGDLDDALAEARAHQHLDQQIHQNTGALAALEQRVATALAQLGRWQGDADSLFQAALPDLTVLRSQVEQARDQAREHQALAKDRHKLDEELARVQVDLLQLAKGGEVPSVDRLRAARQDRDSQWASLADAWQAGVPAIERRSEIDGHGGAVATADDLADLLLGEADRVQQQMELSAREQHLLAQQQLATRALADASARMASQAEAARAVWQQLPLTVAEPVDMLPWLEAALALRGLLTERAALRHALAADRHSRQLARQQLAAALGSAANPPAGDTLAPVLALAKRTVDSYQQQVQQREAVQADVNRLTREQPGRQQQLAAAEQSLASWQASWALCMADLDLPAIASFGQAQDLLEATERIQALQLEVAKGSRRVAGILDREQTFAAEVAELARDLAPELVPEPPDQVALVLQERVDLAVRETERMQDLSERLQEEEAGLGVARAAAASAQQVLTELAGLAGVAGSSELALVLDRQRHAAERRARLQEQEDQLATEPMPLSALVAEAAEVAGDAGNPADVARAELDRLDAELKSTLEPQLLEAVAAHTEAKLAFDAMQGTDAASDKAEEIQQLVAECQELARECAVLRLARRVLSNAVERYRQEHRSPILAAASSTFARLSGGAFAGVDTRFGDQDEPELVAVRGDQQLAMAELSTGSRDQLYLAMRLASLGHYLDRTEGLPLIVDDILVQFDDNRTANTLAALADFSSYTQVILFTHHQRVVEQAQAIPDATGRVFVHDLAQLVATAGASVAEVAD